MQGVAGFLHPGHVTEYADSFPSQDKTVLWRKSKKAKEVRRRTCCTGQEGEASMDIRVAVAAGKPGVNIVKLSGRLDATTCEAAQPVILGALEKSAGGIVLNMASVEFISSAGLRIMVMLIKKATADKKKLALVGVQPAIYKIFKIAAMDKVFRFFEEDSDAVRELWP
jgi:anti-anti-sigma factor